MPNDLKERTRRFALDVLRFCSTLPAKAEFRMIAGQLMRAGTSVGANYRAACRAKSKADFINKLSIVEEEADESEYWLELVENFSTANHSELVRLKSEASQLVAIMVQSKKTARNSNQPTMAQRPNSQLEIRNSKFS
jgi:four helix bundle protein